MNYKLNNNEEEKTGFIKTIKGFSSFIGGELRPLMLALFFVVISSIANILGPKIQGDALDNLLTNRDLNNLLSFVLLMAGVYVVGSIASYGQILVTGRLGQRVLFKLRNSVFNKLQSLPLAFFNANRGGDLISRINNDTDKVNSFLSEYLIRLIGSMFILVGIAISMLLLNVHLALVTLSVTLILFVITQVISPLLKRLNRVSLDATGNLSSQIQEGLSAFKVIIAFDRRDYFEDRFQEYNEKNYLASVKADIANQSLKPIYDLASNAAQIIVIVYGLTLIKEGNLTFGILFTFFTYTQRFYDPLRIIASIWSNVQLAMAAWSRIQEIQNMNSDLKVIESTQDQSLGSVNDIVTFKNVSFGYDHDNPILKDINIELEKGKTYALVGPTGGGKSTTAALMARLYDPTSGIIEFYNKDIRSYKPEELSEKIGFILQDPLLFTGTVGENIKYGNPLLIELNTEDLYNELKKVGLEKFIDKFEKGLETEINNNAENISLGQKQIISFIRTILRKPELLILDEATANIDTVTEELLQDIINKLPEDTAKVIIAHRLNTIKKADQIFFVNSGQIDKAKDYESVQDMILNQKRNS